MSYSSMRKTLAMVTLINLLELPLSVNTETVPSRTLTPIEKLNSPSRSEIFLLLFLLLVMVYMLVRCWRTEPRLVELAEITGATFQIGRILVAQKSALAELNTLPQPSTQQQQMAISAQAQAITSQETVARALRRRLTIQAGIAAAQQRAAADQVAALNALTALGIPQPTIQQAQLDAQTKQTALMALFARILNPQQDAQQPAVQPQVAVNINQPNNDAAQPLLQQQPPQTNLRCTIL
jgi:hypothetical protein